MDKNWSLKVFAALGAVFFVNGCATIGGQCSATSVTTKRAPSEVQNSAQNEDAVELFSTPTDLHEHWRTWIQQAKKSIVMEMFHLTDKDVVGDLLAKDKKIKITLILDSNEIKSKTSAAIVKQFTDSGHISVFPSSPKPNGFEMTHTKAMIIDSTTALITSINVVQGEPATTRDYGIVTHDKAIIKEMAAVFKADVTNSKNHTGATPSKALKVASLLWSPVDSENKLAALIAEASAIPNGNDRFVYSTVENLGDPKIQEALKQAASDGVDVRLIVPKCALGTGNRNYNYFADMPGVKIKVAPTPSTAQAPYMHGKMIVIGSHKAYLGSVNFSVNSTQNNRELGVIFVNQAAADSLKNLFMDDWGVAEDIDATQPKPNCPAF